MKTHTEILHDLDRAIVSCRDEAAKALLARYRGELPGAWASEAVVRAAFRSMPRPWLGRTGVYLPFSAGR